MCGICGVVHLDGAAVSPVLLKRMTDVLAHRGPDGEGQFVDGSVGLGHRRLAIIDLSPSGRQPMANEANDVVITFNGEIYNFQELKVELEALGHRFRSRTDTEVVLHAFLQWGEDCVKRLNGMFAFAIWDKRRRRVVLARDRYGVKPLYWWRNEDRFLFGSEIKAILEDAGVPRRVSYPALDEYFTFQNVLSDLTLFEGVRLLRPGHLLTIELDGDAEPRIRQYWDYPFHERVELSDAEAEEKVFRLFEQAVNRQLMSDVPVGSYLSGGMDSGSITAVASRSLPRLTTFTGGFDLSSASGLELGFDERAAAEVLANRFKTEHYEVVLHAGDMEWVLPRLVRHLEDLRVGQSYPNWYVSRLASKFVKVVLGGAGGDELFGGYPWRYHQVLGSRDEADFLRRYYGFWQRLVPDGDKARLFNERTRREIGDHSTFDVFASVFAGFPRKLASEEDFVDAALYFELKTFLHGLLVVEDKLSMAHSLEARVPFLDDDLVELAVRLPPDQKFRRADGPESLDENLPDKRRAQELRSAEGKVVLRKAMARLVPREITDRTKQGFSAPDASWFRGESIDYINRLLRDPRARIYDYLSAEFVDEVLDDHCSGRTNRRLLIWSLLCFEWWLREFRIEPVGRT